jgi:hypothetical protein
MDATLEAVPKRVCIGVQRVQQQQRLAAAAAAAVFGTRGSVGSEVEFCSAGTWPALFRLFFKIGA